jgi:hypothetical protein
MATLFNTQISDTYEGLLKTIDNTAITATLKELTDGSGNQSGLYLNTAGDFKVSNILEWGSLKDTGTGVTITQFVTSTDGIENFNNNTTLPTSAAVKLYVDTYITAQDLDFSGDTGIGAVDLDSQVFSITGVNGVVTSAVSQGLLIDTGSLDIRITNNTSNIAINATAISTETAARIAADGVLQSNIDAEAATRLANDNTLQSNIDAEATTRAANDVTLQNNINTEATTRASEDANLQSQINSGSTGLAAETAARIAADNTLQTNIDSEATTRAANDVILQGNITTEQTARIAADTTLQTNIDTEETERIAGDANLQSQITTGDTGLATETAARIAADNILQGNIDAEASTRATADTTLTNNLATEVTNRTTADTTLQTNINTEATTRAAADTTLQNNIDAEEAARISADTTLQTNITSEETARIAADTNLQNQINTNETDITNLQSSKQSISEKGQADGYVPLDGNVKISETYLPESVLGGLSYQGTWNANTNTPTLPTPSTVKGHYYVVTTDGTYLGITYNVGDWVISNGTSWEKVDNTESVSSVFGRLGNIVATQSDYSSFYPLISDLNAEIAARIAADTTLQNNINGITLSSLGFTGDTNANYITDNNQLINGAGYVTSSGNTIIGTDADIDTSGAEVIDIINMTDGVILSHSLRNLTLADLGYTGATNANYITNNNQLINGAGYITAASLQGVPAILSNGSTPSLNTGITGSEIRSLIGAGTVTQVSGINGLSGSGIGSVQISVDYSGSGNIIDTATDGITIVPTDKILYEDATDSIVKEIAVSSLLALSPQGTVTGTGLDKKVAVWTSGTSISDGPITFSGNNATFAGYVTATRLRAGDGTDGYFFSDTAGRTAFTGGNFYIQSGVGTYYNYANTQYHGDSSGDNHFFRGNNLSGDNWSILPTGEAFFTDLNVTTGNLDMNSGNILIDSSHGFINSGSWTKNATPYGYIEFGPANTSHAHIYTDRPNFYFNKQLTVNGATVWNSGNDGSGSGLDADLLDGVHKPTNFSATSQTYTTIATGQWDLPTGSSVFSKSDSVGGPGAVGYWYVTGRRDVGGGYGGIYSSYTTGQHWFGYNGSGTANPTWDKIWTDKTFTPGNYLPLTGGTMSGAISFGSSNANVNLSRGSFITFYEDGNSAHAIGSRNSSGAESDDIRINSYGAVYINLDSNNNNTSGADFAIGKHGAGTGAISQFFKVSGETGNVGIGTTSPDAKLELSSVQPRIRLTDTTTGISSGSTTGAIDFYTSDSSSEGNAVNAKIESYADSIYGRLGLRFFTGGGGAPTQAVTINWAGNVGIGTTNPGANLEVAGGSVILGQNKIDGSSDNLKIMSDYASVSGLSTIEFSVDNSEKMRILNNGNVGIGTTSPQAKLHVSGGSSIETTLIVGAEGTGSDKSARVFLNEGEGGVSNSKDYGFSLAYDGQGAQYGGLSANQFGILRHNNSAAGAAVMVMNRTNNNTTFTGSVTATSYINSSDERLKENIKELSGNVKVNWKTFELKVEKGQKRYGVIAQELEKTNPEFVKEDSQGFKSVNYIDLLIAKIAELEQRIQLIENK